MKERIIEAVMKYLDDVKISDISQEMMSLIMTSEHATKKQLERLQTLLRGEGYDC